MEESLLRRLTGDTGTGKDFRLYPHQVEAIEKVDLGRSVLVSVPTASGKSLIAYYGILRTLRMGGKAIYIAPLKALVKEKFSEIKEILGNEYSAGISMGDYDSGADLINRFDVLVCTSEKADSMMHHDPDYFSRLSLMVIDEIHNIGDPSRGPTLEIIVSVARMINPDLQMIFLSATLKNNEEIGRWLNSDVVVSDFRPVPLKKFIINKRKILDTDLLEISRLKNDITDVIENTIDSGGQVLIFLNTRKRAETFARDIGNQFRSRYLRNDIPLPPDDSSRFVSPLKDIIPYGVAFHHAGLPYAYRELIEENFRNGNIRVLTATPTLAAGINLPARTVIIRDLTRFSNGYTSYISNMEIEQMLGRAGRPKYDRYGEAYIYCPTDNSVDKVRDFLENGSEEIQSGLCTEKTMGFNTLALISTGLCRSEEDIMNFYRSTMYSMQNGFENLGTMAEHSLKILLENDFIKEINGYLEPTELGRLTSSLYIDPRTAIEILEMLEMDGLNEAKVLYHICRTPDVIGIFPNRQDDDMLTGFFAEINEDPESEEDLSAAKTAMMLNEWINEKPIYEIEEEFNVGSGDIEAKKSTAEWISFSASRMARHYRREYAPFLDMLSLRISEGIRDEIIPLVSIPGVGRVRARVLYSNGFKSIKELSEADPAGISQIRGFSSVMAGRIISYARNQVKANGIDNAS
ncbi:MAG: DEAD/DEAH box helicase [Candidatus Thermoplasmatota archaeon]|nr:DEAD/DEAH box helicase [Candidatus Thermoplasmatota archaeon]MCL5790642.1 DEAD/DEAH box helicase [Candidatus Thermoplasmatota archaeon]